MEWTYGGRSRFSMVYVDYGCFSCNFNKIEDEQTRGLESCISAACFETVRNTVFLRYSEYYYLGYS